MNSHSKRTLTMTIIGLCAAIAWPVLAGIRDYEFQLVQSEVKKSDAAHGRRAPRRQTNRQRGAGRGDLRQTHRHGA